MIERAAGRYGWHALWLTLVGATSLLVAAGQLATPIEPSPWVLHEHVHGWFTAGGGWANTGAVALWAEFRAASPTTASATSRSTDRAGTWEHFSRRSRCYSHRANVGAYGAMRCSTRRPSEPQGGGLYRLFVPVVGVVSDLA